MAINFTVSVDLGQKQDYSALVLAERPLWLGSRWVYLTDHTPDEAQKLLRQWQAAGMPDGGNDWTLNVIHIQRWPLGSSYPSIVADVQDKLRQLQQAEQVEVRLVCDATGVGNAVVDMFTERGMHPIALTITGGVTVSASSRYAVSVPKRDLVFASVALLENGRLRWPAGDPTVAILVQELKSFQMRYSKAGNELFEAERRAHDDLTLALSMATWLSTTRGAQQLGAPSWLLG